MPKKNSLLIQKYLSNKKYSGWGDRTLAKIIFKENPETFKTLEVVRNYIRYYVGHSGDLNRKYLKDKSFVKLLNYNYNKNIPYRSEHYQYSVAAKKKVNKSKFYLVTWAQNNTNPHRNLLENIEAYSKYLQAEIVVILGRYKNPTSVDTSIDEEWAKEIIAYSTARRSHIHPSLELLGDIRIQPTAKNPLTGMQNISGLKSAILGHPKLQQETIPALNGYEPKLLFTTGAVTKPNYTDSKAGKLGEFHHCYGFVIVEIKNNKTFFIRQVTATNNGDFCDLDNTVKNGVVSKIKNISHAVLGDKHIGLHCPIVEKQQKKMLDKLKPKYTVIHDIFNGTSVNHHIDKDPIKRYMLQQIGDNLLKKEVEQMVSWVHEFIKYNLVVVASNHNDWLDKYIKNGDWKKDIANAMEYIKYSDVLLSGKATKGLIAYILDSEFGNKITTLGRNDSFRLNGIELSQHGDLGSNGSRGNINNFRRLSTKMTVGDSHTPRRLDGVFYVGTSTILRQDWNNGASSWKNCDVICHTNGKRQQIFYMGTGREFSMLL